MKEHRFLVATLVSNYPDIHQRLRSVGALDIIVVFWAKTTRVGAARLSFSPEYVGRTLSDLPLSHAELQNIYI